MINFFLLFLFYISLVQRLLPTNWWCINRLSNWMSTTSAGYNHCNCTNNTPSNNKKCTIMGWCTGKNCTKTKTIFGCWSIRCEWKIHNRKTQIGNIGWWKAAAIKCEHWNSQRIFIWNCKQFIITTRSTIDPTAAASAAITVKRTNW